VVKVVDLRPTGITPHGFDPHPPHQHTFAVEQVQKVWQKPYKNVGIMFGATFLKRLKSRISLGVESLPVTQ
jgi:hypothetical protein